MALLRFNSLPSTLRIVVSGGRAGGKRVRGSLRTKVRGVTDGEVVHVNPVTTVSARLAHPEDGRSLRHVRDLTERTLGIRRILDYHDLYATDQWFEGDRFRRWTMEQGSVGAGARALVQLIERPGFDRRRFRPGDGGNPKARVAALAAPSGGATAANVINGLLDAAGGAAALTGPEGFALASALVVFKQLISLGLEDSGNKTGGDDQLSAQLRALSAQITQLENHLDGELLKLRIGPISDLGTRIQATQNNFLSMLKFAKVVENKTLPDDKRDEARTDLATATSDFLRAAQLLKDEQAAATLNSALTDEQSGGTLKEPVKGPALIPAVRQQIGKQHFFTRESSQDIRGFFKYYEWVQTQLATVLTEFYMLGGGCALTSNDCRPARGVAEERIKEIQGNIARQKATLPPKDLDPRVVIDRTTRRMWLLEPTYRRNPEILDRGIVLEEGGTGLYGPSRYRLAKNDYYFPALDNELGWTGYSAGWRIPTAGDYQELFAGPGPEGGPLARLDSLGVRFNGKALKGGSPLWLAGDFYANRNAGALAGPARVEAVVYKLLSNGTLDRQRFTLGTSCTFEQPPGFQVWTPSCTWTRGADAFILWYRGPMTDAQGGVYWCNPARARSWDPAKC